MENPLIFLILKAHKVSKTLKYLSDPHFQNLHVKIYKNFFYLTLISPLFTYFLLVYVSGVRMLEDRSNKKWGNNEEYKKYKKDTPMLFPKLFNN